MSLNYPTFHLHKNFLFSIQMMHHKKIFNDVNVLCIFKLIEYIIYVYLKDKESKMETISNMTQEQKDEIVEYINSNGGIESRKKRLGEIKLEISEQKKELEKFEKGHIVEFVPVLRDENEKIVFIISDDEKIEFPVAITSVKGRSHKTVAKWLTDETLTNKAVNIYKRDFITVREAIELSISLKENIMTGIENEINLYYKCL